MGGENNTSRGSGALSPRGGSGSELPPFSHISCELSLILNTLTCSC